MIPIALAIIQSISEAEEKNGHSNGYLPLTNADFLLWQIFRNVSGGTVESGVFEKLNQDDRSFAKVPTKQFYPKIPHTSLITS